MTPTGRTPCKTRRSSPRGPFSSHIVKTCPICGNRFSPTSPNQKACSPECSDILRRQSTHAYYKRHHKLRPRLTKICTECGKTFTTGYPKKLTCCTACAEQRRKRLSIQGK